jgi:hypothetical protein
MEKARLKLVAERELVIEVMKEVAAKESALSVQVSWT